MNTKLLALAASLALTAFSSAQAEITAVKVDPPSARVGENVIITVSAEGEGVQFCGLRIEFGDGENRDIKIASSEQQFPVTVTRAYAKAGTFTVKARGKTVTTHARCPGSAEAVVTIAAPVPAKATSSGVSCPAGYGMQGKPGKAGDFICKASKGAKKPERVMDCGDKLEYFQTKTTLGCRKMKTSTPK